MTKSLNLPSSQLALALVGLIMVVTSACGGSSATLVLLAPDFWSDALVEDVQAELDRVLM